MPVPGATSHSGTGKIKIFILWQIVTDWMFWRGMVMFRALNEKVYILCWIFASLLLLCVLGYFLVGLIIKRHGISLKLLLIGEEYIFASIGSIVIFLTLLFPVAFYVWGLTFVLMHFV